MTNIEQLEEKAELELERVNHKIDELKLEAKSAEIESKERVNSMVEDLKVKREALNKWLGQIKTQGQDAASSALDKLSDAIDNLRDSVRNVDSKSARAS